MKNLKEILEEKTGKEIKLKENNNITWLGSLYDVESESGNARFMTKRNEITKKLENIYFVHFDNEEIKKTVVDSLTVSTNENVDNIGVLDGKKIPLRALSFNQRTYMTMCAGHMGNQVFETVEEVLHTSQEEITSKQNQLGQKGLKELVEVIEKLGYKIKER